MLRKSLTLILIFMLLVILTDAFAVSPKERSFEFTYSFTITDIPKDSKEAAFWVPIPQSNDFQYITDISVDGEIEYSINTDTVYKNMMLYAKIPTNGADQIPVSVNFKVKRIEMSNDSAMKTDDSDKSIFLESNRLVSISDRVKEISSGVTKDKKAVIDKARAIYDYVFDNMKYDKSGEGWGRGDTEYACDAGSGNCTDFHSLFISLARAAGIPARFKIGFPIPTDKDSGDIGGYHCWAEFYDGRWIPVDISEAKKHPEKKEYFFGNVCENRFEATLGRDLTLNPEQAGDKLNFFIYPYIEIDGFSHSMYSKNFSFKNI